MTAKVYDQTIDQTVLVLEGGDPCVECGGRGYTIKMSGHRKCWYCEGTGVQPDDDPTLEDGEEWIGEMLKQIK